MNKQQGKVVALLVTCSIAVATTASAFSDVTGAEQEKIVTSLQSQGIIQGISKDLFAPSKTLTYAQGVQMAVKAMDLKVQPDLYNGSFSNIPASAWYAQAYRIAAENGLPVSGDINPASSLTREQFANILYKAVSATGHYPTVRMLVTVKDEQKIEADVRGAVQFLLLTKIAEVDEQHNFNPDRNITRMEAAEMIYKAADFVKNHQPISAQPVEEPEQSGVTMNVKKVSDEQNQIIITRNQAPNPGYGIEVDHIDYVDDANAVVYYKLLSPKPGEMNLQVITDTQTSTLVDSKYKVTIQAAEGYSDAHPGSQPVK